MSFLYALLEKYLIRVIVASFLFVLLIPLYLLVFEPHKDIIYHLGKTEVADLNAASARDNLYARAMGRIDPDSLSIRTNVLKTQLTGCLFRLNGFPEQWVVHLRQGRLFDQLRSIYAEYREEKYKNAAESIVSGRKPPVKDILDDEIVIARLRDRLTASDVTLQGRLYDSTGFFEVFGRYLYRDEADIEGYYTKHNMELKAGSGYKRFFASLFGEEQNPAIVYYLLHAGEEPGIAGLKDTPVILFLVPIGVVALVLAWLAFALFRIAWRVAVRTRAATLPRNV